MNSRTSMAQREEVIRRTVYVSDIDHQVRSYCDCLGIIEILFKFVFFLFVLINKLKYIWLHGFRLLKNNLQLSLSAVVR